VTFRHLPDILELNTGLKLLAFIASGITPPRPPSVLRSILCSTAAQPPS